MLLCVLFLLFIFFFFCFFFFFQAEDGIRDTSVTGVQTCALPIYAYTQAIWQEYVGSGKVSEEAFRNGRRAFVEELLDKPRSEERRVGKECRSRWSTYH